MVTGTYFSTKYPGSVQNDSKLKFSDYVDLTTHAPVIGDLTTTPIGSNPIFHFTDIAGDYYTAFAELAAKDGPSTHSVINYIN